jgi:hypothetical protein
MTHMRTTGRNFLHALGITCLVAGVLGGVYALMAVLMDVIGDTMDGHEPYRLSETLPGAFFVFRQAFLCSGPIVLIISFAVLQRLRQKK